MWITKISLLNVAGTVRDEEDENWDYLREGALALEDHYLKETLMPIKQGPNLLFINI